MEQLLVILGVLAVIALNVGVFYLLFSWIGWWAIPVLMFIGPTARGAAR